MNDFIPKYEDTKPVNQDSFIPQYEDTKPAENVFFSPTKRNYAALQKAFTSENPLDFIDDEKVRKDLDFVISQAENPDEERRKWALAAYFAQMQMKDLNFCHGNLDGLIARYNNGQPQSVDSAYRSVQELFKVQQQGEGNTYNAVKAGGARVGKTAADIGWGLTKILMFNPAEIEAQKMFLDEKSKAAFDKGIEGVKKSVDTLHKDTRGYYQDIYDKNAYLALDADWFTRWNNGRGFRNAFNAFVMSAPDMALQLTAAKFMGPAVFAATIGTTSAVEKYYDNSENSNMTEDQRAKNAIMTGAINSGAAWMLGSMVKGKVPFLNKIQFKNEMVKYITYFASAYGSEFTQEAAEQLAENALDLHTGVYGDVAKMSPADYRKKLWNGVFESGFIGGFPGAGGAALGFKAFKQNLQYRNQVVSNLENAKQEILNSENLTDTQKAVAAKIDILLDAGNINDMAAAGQALAEVRQVRESEQQQQEITEDMPYEQQIEINSVESEENIQLRKMLKFNPQDTIDEANELAANFNDIDLHIFNTPEELPSEIIAQIERDGIEQNRVRAWIDMDNMRDVYLVASNVRPSDVSRTLGHEIIGHKGLRSVFGENFNTILDSVYNSHSEELIQYARTYNRDTETIEGRRYLTEEFLSDCADANVKPSWWKEFIASLRQMLRRIFPKMRISDADINGWLSKAYRAVQQQSVQTATENGVRYAIIGEKGAAALDKYSYQNNLDNLQTAKQMLEAGKDAADIKLATGWEKGGDGKWRMEVPDLTVIIKRKLPDGNEYNIDNFAFQDDYLENIINAPELFSAYGQLRRIRVRSVDLDSLGSYSKQNNTIYLNYNDFINLPNSKQELLLRSVLIHEVQHAIQHIEGFASGGTLNTAVNENQDPVLQRHIAKANELMKERESLENKLSELEKSPEENEKQISSIKHRIERIETLLDTNRLNAEMATSPQTTYKRLAGEVEARNAERRQFFTGEEKRNSLLEASEDVAEESKIYLFDNAGESQMADGLFKYFSGSISDFLQKIKNTSNNQLIKKIIAPVSPKIAKYLYLKGIQIDLNYNHVIDNYSIIHVMNEHGKNSTEETRGQVPITEEDIKNIDNIINNYDGIVVDEKGGIVYSKRMQDGTVIYVEEVRRGRKELAFKTMRKMKGNIPNDLMEKMFSPENLNVLNESAILSFDDIILQKSEKSSGNQENFRFSVIQMSEDEQNDYVNVLKPFMLKNPTAGKSDVMEFLKGKGVNISDKEAWYCAMIAHSENKSAIAKERVKRRNDWLYENVDLYRQVIDVAGSDFKIKPSLTFDGEDFTGSFISPEFRKYSRKRKQRNDESDKQYKNYLKRREKALANAEGMSSDEIAQAIAEKYGQDAQEVEQKLIDFFRDLTKTELNKKYSDYLAEKNFETKELDRRLLLEWDRQQEQERIQEALEIITKKGTLITPEWINENTKTYKKLYEMVLGEKAPGVPTKKQINALNVAIMNESDNAPELAKGYKIAYDQITEEKRIELAKMKDKMLADKFDIQQVQQAAKDFAYANVDRGFREKFISRAIALGKYLNTPTAKYPNGRRQAELEKLMSEMLDFQENLHKQNAILEINQLLKRNKTKRTAKNVPFSPMGERQVALDRIAAVVKMSPETVAGVLRYDFEQKHALSETLEMLVDADEDTENREGRILAEIRKIDNDIFYLQNFGALELKKLDAVESALKKLKKFIKDGREEFSEARNEDREKFNELRLNVRKEMNSGSLETPSQNELDKSVNPLENYNYMSMSLNDMFDILSGTDNIVAKDNSQAGKFEQMVDEAAQKEQTMLNNMQSVFDKKLAEHGVTSIVGRGRFLRSTMQEENTGVFIEEYASLMKDGKNMIPQWDKGRPSRKEFVYVDHARKILEDLNNGEKITELLPVQGDDSSNKLEKLKLIREDLNKLTKNIGRTFTLTQKKDGKIRVYTDTDGGNVISLDFELADLPQAKSMIEADGIRPLAIDNFALHGAREQLIQYDAGITPESRLNMGDDIDDIQWQSFVEDGFKYGKVYFIGSNPNMRTRQKELKLTPGAAVQLILTWEQDYYQPAMMWNGYSQQTIDQLKNYLNDKNPAFLDVIYALRDYVRDTQPELDKAVFERYGVHLPEQKNFWYADFKGNLTDRVQDAGFGNQSGGLTVNANFLTGRRLHFLAPSTNSNAYTLFLTKQLEQAHFVAWTQTIRTLRAVYNDKAVQFTMRKNFGQAFWNNFKKKLETLAAGGVVADKAAQIIGGFYKTWAPSNIALNPASALKQLAGGLSYAHYVPVDKLMRYLPEANQWNPEYRRWRDFVMNSDFIKNRKEGTGLNPNLGGLLNFSRKGKKISPVADAMMKKMLTLTTSADILSTTTWGYAAYRYFYETAINKGYSEKAAFDFAYRWWMKSTEKTQQSGYLKDLNSFSTNPLLRAFTTYMTNPMQTAALELTALQKVLKNPTTANKKNLINKFIVNHLIVSTAMNLIGSIMKHGFNFEDWAEDLDNYIAGWLLGSFDSLFIAGQALSALIAVLSNDYFDALNKFDFMPMFNDYIRDVSKIKKFIEGKDLDVLDSMQIMGDLMMAGGPPVSRATGILLRASAKLGKRVEKWFEN